MSDQPPRRRVRTTIEIDTDDLAQLHDRLYELATRSFDWHRRESMHLDIISGAGYTVRTDVDLSAPVGDDYLAALDKWFTERKAARHAD